jgi:hypothetical protein
MKKILAVSLITFISLILTGCYHPIQFPSDQHTRKQIVDKEKQALLNAGEKDFALQRDRMIAEFRAQMPERLYSDLIAGERQENAITPQERNYFTDAFDKFPKRWVLQGFAFDSNPRWLDDKHIAFSTRSTPGWVANNNEPPRIVSLNIDTGEMTDSGYRGKLECLNHKAELIVSLDANPISSTKVMDEVSWHSGTWGEPLQVTPSPYKHFMPKYLCKFFPIGKLTEVSATKLTIPEGGHTIFPLLPKHGVLKEDLIRESEFSLLRIKLQKANGSVSRILTSFPDPDNFEYQPWSESYFLSKRATASSITIYPFGEVVFNEPPKLINYWAHYRFVKAQAVGTKAGMLWAAFSETKKWAKHGLYLETKNELLRIEEGGIGLETVISPNGCRVLTYVERGDITAIKRTGQKGHMLIDLCNTGVQQ